MKRETPSVGRGLRKAGTGKPSLASWSAIVKRLLVALAVHEMAPAALVAFLLRILRLGAA